MSTDLVPTTAAAQLAAQRKNDQMQVLDGISNLDWKKLPPPMLAQLLVATKKLQPVQAMVFAIRAYELGVSPFSNECWFNEQTNSVNLTFEGKKIVARNRGYNVGSFKMTKREEKPWPTGRPKIMGIDKDLGVTVQMSVTVNGEKEYPEYTAWLSEWFMPNNPNWKSRTEHMLFLRGCEKVLSFASGVGASEQPGDDDIAHSKLAEAEVDTPTIEVKEVEVKPV
jgi:hypothetical protein